MTVQMVLLPVFVLVALTLGMMFWTGRRGLTGRNEAAGAPYAASPLDILFYALIAIGLPLRKIDLVLVALSWVFVVIRYLEAGVFASAIKGHTHAYIASALVLLAMWFYFALRMLLLL